ncbi:hypothetical protein ABH917_004719 [Thermobifida halotolerans]
MQRVEEAVPHRAGLRPLGDRLVGVGVAQVEQDLSRGQVRVQGLLEGGPRRLGVGHGERGQPLPGRGEPRAEVPAHPVLPRGVDGVEDGVRGGRVDPVGGRGDTGAPVLREQVHPVLPESVVDGGEEALVQHVASHHGGQHHHVDGVVEAGDRVADVGAGLRRVQGARVVVADVDRVLGELCGHVGRVAGGPLRRGGGGRGEGREEGRPHGQATPEEHGDSLDVLVRENSPGAAVAPPGVRTGCPGTRRGGPPRVDGPLRPVRRTASGAAP